MRASNPTLLSSCYPYFTAVKFRFVFLLSGFLFFAACGDDDNEISRSLKFNEITIIDGQALGQATGLVGSEQLNALYIASRETNNAFKFTERVIRYDLVSNEQVESLWEQPDFISKNAHLLDDKLVIIGGTHVNTYSVDLEVDPDTAAHGLSLSRFGSAVYNDELYVWGGDLSGATSSHIRKWNFDDKSFETIGEFPTATTWAHGEIVNGKLYIFGGQQQLSNTASTDLIYAYDLQSNDVETYFLPQEMSRTFTATYKDRIYVAGHVTDENGSLRTQMGIFNTNTKKFSTIEYSVSYNEDFDEDVLTSIQIVQMTIVGNKLYALLGPVDANAGLFLHVAKL